MKEFIPELDERGFIKHASDLKASLRKTHHIVRNSINLCDAEAREEYYRITGRRVAVEHPDTKLKEGMIEDLNIQINQLHTGREAGSKRGIHRKGAYDVDKMVDPMYIQKFFEPTNSRSASTLTDHHMEQIQDALSGLTKQEWTCYVMSRGYCATFAEIAGMLAVSKGTVHKCVERAEKKVSKALEESMFLREFEWEQDKEDE